MRSRACASRICTRRWPLAGRVGAPQLGVDPAAHPAQRHDPVDLVAARARRAGLELQGERAPTGGQLIPALVVAPLFIQRQVEFGVIGQAAMAFSTLLGAFSLIVTQFQTISSYAAVIARLGELGEHAERCEIEQPLE